MKSKAATCRYNANRHAYKIAYPHCTFLRDTTLPTLPPHIYLMPTPVNDRTCTMCKCYAPAAPVK